MTSHSNEKAAPATDDLDPDSLAAIRDLLAQAEPALAPASRRDKKAARAAEKSAETPMPRADKVKTSQPAAAHHEAPVKPRVQSKISGISHGFKDRIKDRVSGFRPTPRLVALVLVGLLVLFRPWLVVGLVLLFAFILTGLFLIVGYDGFWRRVMGVARWYARRHPSRSVELHRKLDNFAMKFDAFLDRFPEGTVDGLYLPDFGDLAEADARHEEALERRFDRLRETGA